jgi:hypothetical protein
MLHGWRMLPERVLLPARAIKIESREQRVLHHAPVRNIVGAV